MSRDIRLGKFVIKTADIAGPGIAGVSGTILLPRVTRLWEIISILSSRFFVGENTRFRLPRHFEAS
jgi:hypothetical protein